jgi:hypothetical protein
VRILAPVAVGMVAATSCCCCGSLQEWFDSFRPGEPTIVAATATPEAPPEPAMPVVPAPGASARVLQGQLLTFPDFPNSALVSYAETPTIASATLTVDDAHPPTEVVAFYRTAALDKGYFIDSEIATGTEPSFQAIRGNVSFRAIAHDAGDLVEFSLTTERTL